jgi:hypothetical protein
MDGSRTPGRRATDPKHVKRWVSYPRSCRSNSKTASFCIRTSHDPQQAPTSMISPAKGASPPLSPCLIHGPGFQPSQNIHYHPKDPGNADKFNRKSQTALTLTGFLAVLGSAKLHTLATVLLTAHRVPRLSVATAIQW